MSRSAMHDGDVQVSACCRRAAPRAAHGL